MNSNKSINWEDLWNVINYIEDKLTNWDKIDSSIYYELYENCIKNYSHLKKEILLVADYPHLLKNLED
jgi:hypothetical protein